MFKQQSACSLVGFSQPKPVSQQCFSLTINQHQPAQTSPETNQRTGRKCALLLYYIFIWLSLLSMLILVLYKKSLQRILQTPHHYRFKVTSRTHPTFSKHYQSMTKGKPAATGTHKTIPSCCKLQYYCSLKMYDPIHILLYQKTTSPSYALTKCESSIQLLKQLGTTAITKVNQKS